MALVSPLAALALLIPTSASAIFHQMKISEVGRGSTGAGFNDAFVELQMYSGGQQFVSGKELRFFDASGDPVATFTIPGDAGSGQSQRTILIGDSNVSGGVDFSYAAMAGSVGTSNAVCFVDPDPAIDNLIDCVAWGTFDDSSQASPLPVGNPATAPASGESLIRSTAPGCPTQLEASDDTNDSATDFAIGIPTPRRNTLDPPGAACTTPSFAIAGPSRTKDRTPTFRFTPSEPVEDTACRVDSGAFAPCASPFTTRRLKPGPHTFRVRGAASDDGTVGTSSKSFKVKRKRGRR